MIYLKSDREGEETFLQEPLLGVIEVGQLRADADDEDNSIEDFPGLPTPVSQSASQSVKGSPWSDRSVTLLPTPWLRSEIPRVVVGPPWVSFNYVILSAGTLPYSLQTCRTIS